MIAILTALLLQATDPASMAVTPPPSQSSAPVEASAPTPAAAPAAAPAPPQNAAPQEHCVYEREANSYLSHRVCRTVSDEQATRNRSQHGIEAMQGQRGN